MSDAKHVVKDPDEVLPYTFDWSAWLVSGDTISTSTMTAAGGITVDSDSNTTTTADAVISGGTVNTPATLTNRITTANGYTSDRTIHFRIRER